MLARSWELPTKNNPNSITNNFKHHKLITTTTNEPYVSICRLEAKNYTNHVVSEYGGINCMLDRKKTDWYVSEVYYVYYYLYHVY